MVRNRKNSFKVVRISSRSGGSENPSWPDSAPAGESVPGEQVRLWVTARFRARPPALRPAPSPEDKAWG
jgi:hypothetical protein